MRPDELALPSPALGGQMSLDEALAKRRSIRDLSAHPLARDELSRLLWAAQGVSDPSGLRTAPSAGALHPLEIHVALPEGLFRYRPLDHRLERRGALDARAALWDAALGQDPLRHAPAVLVLTAVPARTEAKYGQRADRYVLLEAGHAAQNLLLEATALGLGAVPIGAFDDEAVCAALRLPDSERPIYLIPVGRAAER